MGGASQIEWAIAFYLIFPGTLVITFPETWLALIGSLVAGWCHLGFKATLGAGFAAFVYTAVRIAIFGSLEGWNLATPLGWAFMVGGALLVAILFFFGCLLGRLFQRVVDRSIYG